MLRPNAVLPSVSDPRDSTPIPTEVGPTTLSSSCSHWWVVCRVLSNTSTPCVLMTATPCLCRHNSLPQAGFRRRKSLYAIVFLRNSAEPECARKLHQFARQPASQRNRPPISAPNRRPKSPGVELAARSAVRVTADVG